MWERNVYERKREKWNVFNVCESKMWKQNAKTCEGESEKMLSKYK